MTIDYMTLVEETKRELHSGCIGKLIEAVEQLLAERTDDKLKIDQLTNERNVALTECSELDNKLRATKFTLFVERHNSEKMEANIKLLNSAVAAAATHVKPTCFDLYEQLTGVLRKTGN